MRLEDIINYINRAVSYFENKIDNPKFFIWSNNFSDLDKIFDSISSNLGAGKDDELLNKFDKVISLIKINIKLAKGHANFDTEEYVMDKNNIFDVKVKYTSTGIKPAKSALKNMNKIYNKHKRLSKLLSNK